MTTRLTPYGSADQAHTVAKIGKGKTPMSLVARMPSAEVVAKVGIDKNFTPPSLAARMPTPEIAAKVGMFGVQGAARTHRLIRRNAKV